MKRSYKTIIMLAVMALTTILAGCTKDDPKNNETDQKQETAFISFSFNGIISSAVIDKNTKTITAQIESTGDLTKITPIFTLSTDATAKVGDVVQTSGVTQNDFTSPVVYTVTSGDGSKTQNWTVVITKSNLEITDLTSSMINKANAVLLPGIYICKTSLTLNSGNTLTISPGVTIRFETGKSITTSNNATIKAKGTAALPIIFTSNRSD